MMDTTLAVAGEIVRAGKTDDLALALRLLKAALDLAQRAGASPEEIRRIRELGSRLE